MGGPSRMRQLNDLTKKIFPDRNLVAKKVAKKAAKKAVEYADEKVFGKTGGRKASSYKNDHHAKLSSLAYEKDFDKKKKAARKLGYDIDEELTTDNHTVFKHRKSGKGIVAYRGTDPSNMDDLAADADIAKGKRDHKRFRDALEVARKAKKKYGDLELTGHSLGGTQALHAYQDLGVKTRVFNPGSTAGDKIKQKGDFGPEIVRHKHDAVSYGLSDFATETYEDDSSITGIPGTNVSGAKYLLSAHNIPGQ